MDSAEYRRAAKATVDEIADYHDSVASRRVIPDVKPGYLRLRLPASPPEEPEPWEAISADVQAHIMPGITHWASPRFMAFFPSGNSFPSALAEMWSTALTGANFNWICNPAVTELEALMLDWLALAFGLPECFLSTGSTHGGGVIHSTASEAIVTVMAAARDAFVAARTAHLSDAHAKEEHHWLLRSRLVALGSSGTHSSTKKAAQILGVRYLDIPVDAATGFALTGPALAATLADLAARGLEPFFLTATMGTTDVCAVDDFAAIATVLAPRRSSPSKLWVHVDAAYAGSALLLPKHKPTAALFSAFDSVNVNPHKWLLVNNDCSTLWLRSRHPLVSAMSVSAPYLVNSFSDASVMPDYRDWQIPLGRRFRALKLWFVLRSFGLRRLRAHIQHGIDLATRFEASLCQRPDVFRVVTRAAFGLVCFCLVRPSLIEANDATRRLYDEVNAQGAFFLTSTLLNDEFVVRVQTGVAAVQEEHIDALFAVLLDTATRLLPPLSQE
ncbi:hypothetical protein CDD81_4215 [Ophiocordyceps australis]|uniref:Aromatic-L-amino-acid decarboxylase n=1 Tax=Ophiocordyceps australis TaxID=1399860 RepID=A0A2C5YCC0_9HYPO|nr:hypothetical protein CDD81_4215 [Ophiocordyceps australis]